MKPTLSQLLAVHRSAVVPMILVSLTSIVGRIQFVDFRWCYHCRIHHRWTSHSETIVFRLGNRDDLEVDKMIFYLCWTGCFTLGLFIGTICKSRHYPQVDGEQDYRNRSGHTKNVKRRKIAKIYQQIFQIFHDDVFRI